MRRNLRVHLVISKTIIPTPIVSVATMAIVTVIAAVGALIKARS